MLGSRRTKDFQAISGCMLLQNWYCKVAYEKQEPKKSAPLEP